MELSEIIKDSFKYPFIDKKQFGLVLLVFLLLGIILFGSFFSIRASAGITPVIMAVSFIIALIVLVLVGGYQLDIIGIACEQDDDVPLFDPVKNIKDGLKVILVYLVFYILNGLISFVGLFAAFALFSTREVIGVAVGIIIYLVVLIVSVIVNWTFSMSLCRLAYHNSLDEALRIREAYQDLRTIGLLNMLIYVIVFGILFAVILFITLMVAVLVASVSNAFVYLIAIMIVFAILSYVVIVSSRAIGLLYSNVVFDFEI